MISLLLLRKKEPGLPRPFRVALYPLFPLLALCIAIISIVAMFIFNLYLGIIYFSILLISFLLYLIIKPGQV
jgi:ethanolamine permease